MFSPFPVRARVLALAVFVAWIANLPPLGQAPTAANSTTPRSLSTRQLVFEGAPDRGNGVLVLKASPADPDSFLPSGRVQVSVQRVSGSNNWPRILREGSYDYHIDASKTLIVRLPFTRDTSEAFRFTLSLRVTDVSGHSIMSGPWADQIDPLTAPREPPALPGGVLHVTPPEGPPRRTGELLLAAQLPAQTPALADSGTVAFRRLSGPPTVIEGGRIRVESDGVRILARPRFRRDNRDDCTFLPALYLRFTSGLALTFSASQPCTIAALPKPGPQEMSVTPQGLTLNLAVRLTFGAPVDVSAFDPGDCQLIVVDAQRPWRGANQYSRPYSVQSAAIVATLTMPRPAFNSLDADMSLRLTDRYGEEWTFSAERIKISSLLSLYWFLPLALLGGVLGAVFSRGRRRATRPKRESTGLRQEERDEGGSKQNKDPDTEAQQSSRLRTLERPERENEPLAPPPSRIQTPDDNASLQGDLGRLHLLEGRINALTALLGSEDELRRIVEESERPWRMGREDVAVGKGPEGLLVRILNDWWGRRVRDRDRLRRDLKRELPGTRFCNLMDVGQTADDITGNAYRFEPTDRDAAWVCFHRSNTSTALVVPTDPAFFTAPAATVILGRLFEGMENAPALMRFVRLERACQLQEVTPGLYAVVSRGMLRVARADEAWFETTRAPATSGATHLGEQDSEQHSLLRLVADHLGRVGKIVEDSRGALGTVRDLLSTQHKDVADLRTKIETLDHTLRHHTHVAAVAGTRQPSEDLIHRIVARINELGPRFDSAVARLTALKQDVERMEARVQSLETQLGSLGQGLGRAEAQLLARSEQLAAHLTAIVERAKAGSRTQDVHGMAAIPPGAGLREETITPRRAAATIGVPSWASQTSSLRARVSETTAEVGREEGEGSGAASSAPPSEDYDLERESIVVDRIVAAAARALATTERARSLAAAEYVERLGTMAASLQMHLPPPGKPNHTGLAVEIVHLSLTEDGLDLHQTVRGQSSEGLSCAQCAGWVGHMVFQLFLAIRGSRSDIRWIVLPPGTFDRSSFPGGYAALLEGPSTGDLVVGGILRTARLKQRQDGPLFSVDLKMRVTGASD